jgi:hypothetical protein
MLGIMWPSVLGLLVQSVAVWLVVGSQGKISGRRVGALG